MKHLTTGILLIILLSCGSKQSDTKFVPKSDTTKIQAIYIDFLDSMKIKNGFVLEVVRDVIKIDSFLKVKKETDTFFIYKSVKDTTTKWNLIQRPFISTERDVDTVIKNLKIVVDTLNKQQ